MSSGAARCSWMIIGAAACGARAQDAAPPAPPPPPPQVVPVPDASEAARALGALEHWTIRFEPMVWYVAPNGTVELPDSSLGDIRAEDLNLDSPRLTPFGELLVRSGRYGLTISGFVFETQDRGAIFEESGTISGVPVAPGDRLLTTYKMTSVEALGSYRFYEAPRGEQTAPGFRLRPTWDVLLGGRLYDVGVDILAPGGGASQDSLLIEPVAGVRFGVDLIENFTVDVTASVGFFSDASDRQTVSWDIAAGFQWNPTRNIGLQIGFRQLAYRLHDGDEGSEFEVNGALAGLYFGGLIRF